MLKVDRTDAKSCPILKINDSHPQIYESIEEVSITLSGYISNKYILFVQ